MGELKWDWKLFGKIHRPRTAAFCRLWEYKDISEEKFIEGLKNSVKTRMSPNKAKAIYKFLVKNGVILNNG